ncbi:SpoIIE family protein phosphatase [Streptomyces sp. NPDC015346]|uniref:SpoIIE family protein phosphatase n=1 Tax=Streptomyces sp. NPDC015346 TaxID=3364954 RepID=UPI003701D0E2
MPDYFRVRGEQPGEGIPQPRGVLDVLGVAAVVLDAGGRIVFWSPQAEQLFGYTAREALGRYAGRLLVDEEHVDLVIRLFAEVMESGQSWAGSFPIRHKDGSTRLMEFRNVRLLDDLGDAYALGIVADHSTVERVETELALCERLVSQSPIGLAVMDRDLRYLLVNPTMERINGVPAEEQLGRTLRETLPFLDVDTIESALLQVLNTGTPLVDQYTVGRTPADPDDEHAWSVSFYRLDGSGGQVLGVATSVVDITERHLAATEADRARRRLALIADASARVGTTLEVDRTAHELAEVAVPELADGAAVDVLDSILALRRAGMTDSGPELFRALAVAAAYPTDMVGAADTAGDLASYAADRLITQCVHTARPVLVSHVGEDDFPRIARDPHAASILAGAGVHSYLAVPLIARGEVLGALDLVRARNPLPFDEDDIILAGELASRAAVAIDNARWYESVRNSAATLQRSLLPRHPPHHAGLEVASRYEPAQASSEVGGDWYDVITLSGDKTALVVGDVMGNGIDAAATMGRLRTATSAFAELDLEPTQVLKHLDKITARLEHYIATCLYAVYDPHRNQCRIANAGHMPPALMRAGRPPELLDLPTGAPLGVGGVPFEATTVEFDPGDRMLLYTDGLVEIHDESIDQRLQVLLHLLEVHDPSLQATCDRLLHALRKPGERDDVALLLARAGHLDALHPPDR